MNHRVSPHARTVGRRTTGLAISVALALGVAACSSDSQSSSTTASADAAKVGYTLDEACVAKIVATLPAAIWSCSPPPRRTRPRAPPRRRSARPATRSAVRS